MPATARLSALLWARVRACVLCLLPALVLPAAGCDIIRLVRDTSTGLKDTNSSLHEATGAMRTTGEQILSVGNTMRELRPSLDRVSELDASMRRLAEMKASMDRLADMRTQFDALQKTMAEVSTLRGPMGQLGALGPRLQAVADLREPMQHVASLEPTLQAVADLRDPMNKLRELSGPMERVATLHDPLQKTGELVGPMTTLAAQVGPVEKAQKGEWLWYVVGSALGWIAITAIGVFLGVYLANRLGAAQRPKLRSQEA